VTEPTIVAALKTLGIHDGYAAIEDRGIVLWIREEQQPTEQELVAAGWIKPAPVEEAQTSTDAG
jgi:hypothetical protein